ncbi:MAG TPA: CHAT domain-containing protein [Candidatus Acidoferrales bacterium]|nr:CHAT domain-containing protein [Candidatus Acidoferrales bacterium]
MKSNHGQISEALQEADREYRRYAANQPEKAWRFRVLEAQLLVVEGKPRDALALTNDEIPGSLSTSEVAARRKMVQGLALGFSQEFVQADADLDQAEALARSHHPELLDEVLLSRGAVRLNEGNYTEAEASFREALQIARTRNNVPSQSRALGSLGNVAMWQEHYDEAVDWYKASLQASQSAGASDASATTLGNIGWSYSALGDFESALAYFQQAENAASINGLMRGQVEWQINIGDIRLQQQDYSAAQDAYQKALALARKINYLTDEAECLDDLAQLDLENGRLDSARQSTEQALALLRDKPDHFLTPYSLLTLGRVEEASRNFEKAAQTFRSVMNDKEAGTALHWEAQARLAKTFADEGKASWAEHEFQGAIATIEAARASVETESFRLSFLTNAINFYSDYIDFLVSQGQAREALAVVEMSRAHSLVEGSGNQKEPEAVSFELRGKSFKPEETAKHLHATLLSYWLGAEKSYLWAVTPAGMKLFSLPPASQINSLVQSYRSGLAGPLDPLETRNPNGIQLFQMLLAPAQELLPHGGRVLILPDGALYDLNFEALLVPTPDLHYWIDDAVVEYTNSLWKLGGATLHETTARNSLLLIGDPSVASPEFPKLPQAASEMREVEGHFPEAREKIFSGAQATPDAYLKSDAGRFTFIHFVAHGIASRTSPLDSAVILSSDGAAYKLYARDIVKEPLGAELVTISACHAAGSRTYSGEGLVGLAWAFLRAGAHGVIAALWDVNDAYTAELMGRLYDGLGKGETPAVALRNGKLASVHSKSPYRKPFYWAAFQTYLGS